MDAARESDEFYFAVGVGAGFEIEAADASESVGDVHFDGGGVDGLGVGVSEREIHGAGASATVHDRDFLWRSLVQREGRSEQQSAQEAKGRFLHSGIIG